MLAARPDCITKANTRPYCHSAARRASGYLLRLTLVHFSSKHISHILLKHGFYISLDFQTESLVGASNLGYILFARQLQKNWVVFQTGVLLLLPGDQQASLLPLSGL